MWTSGESKMDLWLIKTVLQGKDKNQDISLIAGMIYWSKVLLVRYKDPKKKEGTGITCKKAAKQIKVDLKDPDMLWKSLAKLDSKKIEMVSIEKKEEKLWCMIIRQTGKKYFSLKECAAINRDVLPLSNNLAVVAIWSTHTI